MKNIHDKYMYRCLELAQNGLGYVSPNPMVGSVIVHDNKIIGEGYHQMYGKAHAEVNAINSVKDKSLLSQSTIYVNLEPCAHFGKTPPCAELIANLKIPHVVIGMLDPFEKVSGKGIEILKKAGCDVTIGILEDECKILNKRFIQYHNSKRPYIILKWAQTIDGFIDIIREPSNNNRPTWITNEKLRLLVHKWRSEEKSILVGANTVKFDNPILDVRDWYGTNPIRIVLDPNLSISPNAAILNNQAQTLIFNNHKKELIENLEYIKIDFSKNAIKQIIEILYKKEIGSILIEGGAFTLESFINEDLWDEARVFTGNKLFNNGIKAPKIKGDLIYTETFEKDQLHIYINKKA